MSEGVGYYSGIQGVKELYTAAEVTSHIKDGQYKLLKIGEVVTTDTAGAGIVTNSRLVYVVGLVSNTSATPKTTNAPNTPAPKATTSTPSASTTGTSPKTPGQGGQMRSFPSHDLADLDTLHWMESSYGGVWIPADKAEHWAQELVKAHGEHGPKGWRWKAPDGRTYTCSDKGNLARYEPE
jgi:hypothetical protein